MVEYVFKPKAGYDIRAVEINPTVHNSVIFEYDYGRLKNIYPTTNATLFMFKPKLPPEFYRKEIIEKKEIPKSLPEGYWGVGSSPFCQAIYRKASEHFGVNFGDIYRAITREFRMLPHSKETERMLRKLVDWMVKVGFLVWNKKFYAAGMPPDCNPPLIEYTMGMDPIKERIVKFCEERHICTYGEIKEHIVDTLRWLTDTGYLNRCLRELQRDKCLQKIGKEIYQFLKYPELF